MNKSVIIIIIVILLIGGGLGIYFATKTEKNTNSGQTANTSATANTSGEVNTSTVNSADSTGTITTFTEKEASYVMETRQAQQAKVFYLTLSDGELDYNTIKVDKDDKVDIIIKEDGTSLWYEVVGYGVISEGGGSFSAYLAGDFTINCTETTCPTIKFIVSE